MMKKLISAPIFAAMLISCDYQPEREGQEKNDGVVNSENVKQFSQSDDTSVATMLAKILEEDQENGQDSLVVKIMKVQEEVAVLIEEYKETGDKAILDQIVAIMDERLSEVIAAEVESMGEDFEIPEDGEAPEIADIEIPEMDGMEKPDKAAFKQMRVAYKVSHYVYVFSQDAAAIDELKAVLDGAATGLSSMVDEFQALMALEDGEASFEKVMGVMEKAKEALAALDEAALKDLAKEIRSLAKDKFKAKMKEKIEEMKGKKGEGLDAKGEGIDIDLENIDLEGKGLEDLDGEIKLPELEGDLKDIPEIGVGEDAIKDAGAVGYGR